MEVIKAIPVSGGVVIGRAFVVHDVLERVAPGMVAPEIVDREVQRLDEAVAEAIRELEADRARAAATLGPEPAKVFEAHLGLLHDATLIDPIRQRIKSERSKAEYAVAEAFRTLAERFRSMDSEVFRQKANDVLDLDRRVLGKLIGMTRDRLARLTEPVIVIAHELTPGEAAAFDLTKVLAMATDAGGRTSHTSIVAAALGIPVVVGCHRLSLLVNDGDEIVIDGRTGVVVVRPDAETLEQYRRDMKRVAKAEQDLRALAELPSVTLDGVAIRLMGNIEFTHEIEAVLANGGEGVGLYRTEFLYLASATEPTERDHFEAYKRSLEMLDGRSLTLRTLDLGADKYTQERAEEPERNPFLGLRSIRYCLQHLPLFKTQLRAILRASALGPLRVMFPLISSSMELRQTKMILRDVMDECQEEGIAFDRDVPIGMMVETPSAALMAASFAREVAFFSIGTNDLIQYTLAVDRGNERVANLYSGANPAVVRLVKGVVRVGNRFGIETSLCGELAGDVEYTMLLLGLGLRTLSLVPSQIPHVKRVIRSVDIPACERLARKVGSLDSERQVRKCLEEELRKVLPEVAGGWSVE
jgi:phosphotransferase system enzyme I (PtsI)